MAEGKLSLIIPSVLYLPYQFSGMTYSAVSYLSGSYSSDKKVRNGGRMTRLDEMTIGEINGK